MLRAFATENGSLNVDALFLERQAALERRRANKPVAEVHTLLLWTTKFASFWLSAFLTELQCSTHVTAILTTCSSVPSALFPILVYHINSNKCY